MTLAGTLSPDSTRARDGAGHRPRPALRAAVVLLLPLACAEAHADADAGSCALPARDAAQPARSIDQLLAAMTLEEKLGQLIQLPGGGTQTGPRVPEGGEDMVRNGRVGSFLGIHGADYTRQMQRIAVEESRLGIPLLFAYDVIHGFRTLFPVPLAESSSFDPVEVEKATRVAAVEATANGLHWTFAPMVDITRDPRWGRVVEGAGEDPYLGAAMARARVRGFQGDDLRAVDTMLATAKHFVAYGAAEGGRDYNSADISPQTLHDLYLPPFRAAVDAGVGSIMASFNEINGIPMHAHGPLINGTLRRDWNFQGLVVSDFTGVLEMVAHRFAADREAAGVAAISAGVDIEMSSDTYLTELGNSIEGKQLELAVVDQAVRRVLDAKCRLGLFDDPYRYSDAERQKAHTLTAANRAAARRMAGRSIVLLRNERAMLPLARDVKRVAVLGPLADAPQEMHGNWAMQARDDEAITPLMGLRAALPGAQITHVAGSDVRGTSTQGFDAAVEAARNAEVVVMFVGEDREMSAEANNRSSLDLPGVQAQLIEAVRATGTPVVVVLLNGRPLSIGGWQDGVRAVVEAWFPGIEGGHAIADVLLGDVNPAARLPITFPRNVGQIPIYYAHKSTGRPPKEQEKYTSKYLDVPWTPLYPFGYGLSYTTFAYDQLSLQQPTITPDGRQTVRVRVTNSGKRDGDEVVQLYVRDEVGSLTRPVKELRGFRRIHLAAGASQLVEFELGAEDLSFTNAQLQRVVEPGAFTVMVGGSSETTLEATFDVVAK
jgi:beta-glucosidase